MYHKVTSISICAMLMTILVLILFVPGDAKAAVVPTEYLIPDGIIQCDFIDSRTGYQGSANAYTAVDGDPGASSVAYWETNDTYLYWGNNTQTGSIQTGWGIGRGIFTLSDPIDLSASDYWQVTATCWVSGMAFLSPAWTQIGGYSLTSNGLWSAFNIGVGYTDDLGVLQYVQMHTSALQDSYWWVDHEGTNDQPPISWDRPQTGTNTYDILLNTLTGAPFTANNIENMVIVVDISLTSQIWSKCTYETGEGIAIALGGIRLGIEPATYTPVSYPNGFILRPDGDAYNEVWLNESDSPNDTFNSVNESTVSGDSDTTFVYTGWDNYSYYEDELQWTLTDPPDEAYDSEEEFYYVYAWVIMKSSIQDYAMDVTFGCAWPYEDYDRRDMTVSGVPTGSYRNYTMYFGLFASWGDNGMVSIDELDDMLGFVTIDQGDIVDYDEFLYVTQFAVICVPITFEESSDTFVSAGIDGIIWILITFLPALALNTVMPKYGLMAGLALMLFVFGTTMNGYYPITIIGLMGIAVCIFKGGFG